MVTFAGFVFDQSQTNKSKTPQGDLNRSYRHINYNSWYRLFILTSLFLVFVCWKGGGCVFVFLIWAYISAKLELFSIITTQSLTWQQIYLLHNLQEIKLIPGVGLTFLILSF